MTVASSPAASAPPATPELGSSVGVMLLSAIILSALYGVTVMQTWYYYDNFPEDSRTMKAMVAVVWVLDTLTIVLDTHTIYFYLIDNFNNPSALGIQVWSAPVEIPVTYGVVIIVQLFFVRRIYQLRPHAWYIPLPMGIMAVASFGLDIAIIVQIFTNTTSWSDTSSAGIIDPLIAAWVLGMFIDFSITIVLCWYLWREKVYVLNRTHRVLNRIIAFSVNRGAIAAVVQVMTFVTKIIFPDTLVWIAFPKALCIVYSISMLATLNSRVALRGMMGDVDSYSIELPGDTQPAVEHRANGATTLLFRDRTSITETGTIARDDPGANNMETGAPGRPDDRYGMSTL